VSAETVVRTVFRTAETWTAGTWTAGAGCAVRTALLDAGMRGIDRVGRDGGTGTGGEAGSEQRGGCGLANVFHVVHPLVMI
jgi:hypothetical protein